MRSKAADGGAAAEGQPVWYAEIGVVTWFACDAPRPFSVLVMALLTTARSPCQAAGSFQNLQPQMANSKGRDAIRPLAVDAKCNRC